MARQGTGSNHLLTRFHHIKGVVGRGRCAARNKAREQVPADLLKSRTALGRKLLGLMEGCKVKAGVCRVLGHGGAQTSVQRAHTATSDHGSGKTGHPSGRAASCLLTLHPNLQTFQWRDDAGLRGSSQTTGHQAVLKRCLLLLPFPKQFDESIIKDKLEAPPRNHHTEARHKAAPETRQAFSLTDAAHGCKRALEIVAALDAIPLQVHACLHHI
mmetsp:Transcript_11473/g.19403  ORF Transcript_11473/g.19403 Transcript_11473/m.19403 type:complete len:214 (-) Transcript_11473:143-784(-)